VVAALPLLPRLRLLSLTQPQAHPQPLPPADPPRQPSLRPSHPPCQPNQPPRQPPPASNLGPRCLRPTELTPPPIPKGLRPLRHRPYVSQTNRPANLHPNQRRPTLSPPRRTNATPNPNGIASPSPGLACATRAYPGSPAPNKSPIPTGLRPPAQGWPAPRAYPGLISNLDSRLTSH
jgi:hypothetical protein